jgi:hypothetical protein
MLMRTQAKVLELTVATSTGAYSAADQVGVVMKLSNAVADAGGTALIKSISVVDKDKQAASLDILFFDEEPTNAVADNAAADIADSELIGKFLGYVNVPAASYGVLANASVASVQVERLLKSAKAGSKDLWVLVVSRGTPTYPTAEALTLKIGLQQN